ncbi:MAG: hypothetical protein KatS3mg068_1413 [Candidatus Sericytochromatia bacterium]|nr:MAG: hypothetical protein KatS3mg068_1413 [Candidatus Sericytochromatia bacterium]
MPLLLNIEKNSIADKSGIKTGDKVLKINGYKINDQIDFSFHISDEILELEIETKEGKVEYHYLEREYNKSLGISVIPPKITECENACIFCFIHQQPKSMRKSLYIMDDDYRFSFSDGNFITLTNLNPHDWKRIYKLKLSPLYISVHSTNPDIREKNAKKF